MHVAIKRIIFGSQLLSSPRPEVSSSHLKCLFSRLEKLPILRAIKDPHLTHTHGPHSTLNLPPSNLFTQECGMTDEELAFLLSCTHSYQEYESNKDQGDPKERRGLKKRDERKRTEKENRPFQGLCSLRDKAPDDQSDGPILSPTFVALFSG